MGSAADHYMGQKNVEVNTAIDITYGTNDKSFWLNSSTADTGAIKAVADNYNSFIYCR
jgi:hypothetical protein